MKSCFFHWRKCLRDNLRKKQAEKDVSSNTAFNLVYRLTVALAFVAPTMVEEVWTRAIVPIIQLNDLPENAKKWAAYFEATYLGSINPRCSNCVRILQISYCSTGWFFLLVPPKFG